MVDDLDIAEASIWGGGIHDMTEYLRNHALRPKDSAVKQHYPNSDQRGAEWGINVANILRLSTKLNGASVNFSGKDLNEIPNLFLQLLNVDRFNPSERDVLTISSTKDNEPTVLITTTNQKTVRVVVGLYGELPTCLTEHRNNDGEWELLDGFEINSKRMLDLLKVVDKHNANH